MKNFIAIILTSFILITNPQHTLAAEFEDVKSNHNLFEYIESLSKDHIISGFPDNTFKPDEPATRGQMSKFIVKSFAIPINIECEKFEDIDTGNTFYKYIQTLKCARIVSGFSDNSFKSEQNLTRETATKFVILAARYAKNDSTYLSSIYNNIFADVSINNTFRDYINACYSNGIINGYADNKFKPKNLISRGEVAKIIDITRNKINSTSTCINSGIQYQEGQSFQLSDNCNKCICSEGNIKCTLNICTSTIDYTLTLDNYSFKPQVIIARPGQKLNIKLYSEYGFHNFVLEELGIHSENISTGESDQVEVIIPIDTVQNKTYEFYCSIGDHKAKGMIGYIQIY
ncbi:S-layer homology domain-containing protein [Candidatus Dojkabacteria bacterium]|nr:S-layer homology domain-containing protein [Candidatus Dojkabacteria bacterium]